ncbi:MAG: HAD family hydrolase [Patescibacteria group bacterium]
MTTSPNFIFLDRDGTIIRDIGYPHKPEHIEFLPDAVEGLLLLQGQGYRFIMVTNQAGIARGIYSEKEAIEFTNAVERELAEKGVHILKTYFCPHHPDFTGACECRKPKPGLALQAAQEYNISLQKSFFVGDKDSDVEFGRNCCGITFRIANDLYPSTVAPHYEVKNILEVYTILTNVDKLKITPPIHDHV